MGPVPLKNGLRETSIDYRTSCSFSSPFLMTSLLESQVWDDSNPRKTMSQQVLIRRTKTFHSRATCGHVILLFGTTGSYR